MVYRSTVPNIRFLNLNIWEKITKKYEEELKYLKETGFFSKGYNNEEILEFFKKFPFDKEELDKIKRIEEGEKKFDENLLRRFLQKVSLPLGRYWSYPVRVEIKAPIGEKYKKRLERVRDNIELIKELKKIKEEKEEDYLMGEDWEKAISKVRGNE